MTLYDDDIRQAFFWLLGREPEADALEWHRQNLATPADLRRHLLNTIEFANDLTLNHQSDRDGALDLLGTRVAFLHIPKTGGTSLAHVLESGFTTEEIFPDRFGVGRHPARYLAGFRLFHGHYSMQDILLIPGRVRVVTVIREPRARLISQYRFHRSIILEASAARNDVLVSKAALSFEDYLRDPEVRQHPGVDNPATRSLFALHPGVPEPLRMAAAEEYRCGALSRGTAVAVACAALDVMSWVSTTETLDDRAQLLGTALGIDFDLSRLGERRMVTDAMAATDSSRYRAADPVALDARIEELLEPLTNLDARVHAHARAHAPDPAHAPSPAGAEFVSGPGESRLSSRP
jgi:hypothetical protein